MTLQRVYERIQGDFEDCFPNKYASPDKSATIYKFVKDL